MAEQTINLPANLWDERSVGQATLRDWLAALNAYPIDQDLAAPGTQTSLHQLAVLSDGRIIVATQGGVDELSSTFETAGSIAVTVGSDTWTFALAGADLTEPYTWSPSNSNDVTAFYNAVASSTAVTLTLRDFVPTAPSFADDTGDAISAVVGTAITNITVPEAEGSPDPTYAVVGNLPAGLSFNTGTRVLSGTPTAGGSGTILIRATNSEGTADWTVAYQFVADAEAPTVTITAPSAVNEGATASITAAVSGGIYDTLTWEWEVETAGGGSIIGAMASATYGAPMM